MDITLLLHRKSRQEKPVPDYIYICVSDVYKRQQDDLRFIDLYTEYEVMKKQGEKTTYAVAFLANKYSVSERKAVSYTHLC